MNEKRYPAGLLTKWLESLIESLDESLDEKTKKKVMEKCGKACAIYDGDIEEIKAIKRNSENLEEILDQINQEKLWCGKWIKKGNTIYSICKKCGCPFVRSQIIKPSPTFCYCSRGWAKSVFEVILEKPVQVEQKKAIGRGDNICQFIVQFNNK